LELQSAIRLCSTASLIASAQESNDALNYELHIFGKASSQTAPVALSGPAKAAVWVSKNRFVVLDRQRQLTIRDLKNDAKKKLALPGVTVLQMFSAGVGRLLLRVADGVIMYDIQVMKPQGKLNITSRHPVKVILEINVEACLQSWIVHDLITYCLHRCSTWFGLRVIAIAPSSPKRTSTSWTLRCESCARLARPRASRAVIDIKYRLTSLSTY